MDCRTTDPCAGNPGNRAAKHQRNAGAVHHCAVFGYFHQRLRGRLRLRQSLHFGELALSVLRASQRHPHTAEAIVRVGLGGIDPDGFLEMPHSRLPIVACSVDDAEIQMREPQVRIELERLLKVFLGVAFRTRLHFRVAKVGERLQVIRLVVQFCLELSARVVIALLLPVQVPQAEMDLGFTRRRFGCRLKLGYRLIDPIRGIEDFSQKHVDRSRIRIFREEGSEFFDRGFVLLRPHQALSQLVAELGIIGLLGDGRFQRRRGRGEFARSVIAHSEQNPGLKTTGIRFQCFLKRGNRLSKPVQLEKGQPEVQINARQPRILGQSRLVSGRGKVVFAFLCQPESLLRFRSGSRLAPSDRTENYGQDCKGECH